MRILAICLALLASPALADPPAPAEKIPVSEIPEAERSRLEAAYEQAMLRTDVVAALDDRRAASQDLRDAERAAALKADPSVAPLYERSKGDARKLPPEDRRRLAKARRAAAKDPAVKAAEATNRKAADALRETIKKAILAADPGLGPVLEKVRADWSNFPSRQRIQHKRAVSSPSPKSDGATTMMSE